MVKTAMISEHPPSSSEVTSDYSLVNSKDNGDSKNFVHYIIIHKLNGKNYLKWSQSVMMYIRGRGKDDYIIGAKTTPTKNDAS